MQSLFSIFKEEDFLCNFFPCRYTLEHFTGLRWKCWFKSWLQEKTISYIFSLKFLNTLLPALKKKWSQVFLLYYSISKIWCYKLISVAILWQETSDRLSVSKNKCFILSEKCYWARKKIKCKVFWLFRDKVYHIFFNHFLKKSQVWVQFYKNY